MKRHIGILLCLLRPRLRRQVGLTAVCLPALLCLFWYDGTYSVVAYPIYVISAYTLTVWVIWGIGMVKRIKTAVYAHPFGRRYLTDLPFRGRFSLGLATVFNLFYALFEIGAALSSRSFWFGALGTYYLLLALVRGILFGALYQKNSDRRKELLTARLCGWMLLALNAALSAITVQMVLDGKGYVYPGSMIFVMACYSFYSVTISIVNLVRFRKLQSPILSASKVLGIATALVSMLSLQTAMFAAFGGTYADRHLMNALTGGGVCLCLFVMAVLMLINIRGELKHQAMLPAEILPNRP